MRPFLRKLAWKLRCIYSNGRRKQLEARDAMTAAGMQINTLQDEAEWEKRARAIWPEFYDFVGGKEVIDMVLTGIAK